ncbi:MAG: hypothetical protein Q9218_004624 [Villophora microphyllina]
MLLTAPTFVDYLSHFSGHLGPKLGPFITAIITIFPVTLVSVIAACKGVAVRTSGVFNPSTMDKHWLTNRGVEHAINVVIAFLASQTVAQFSIPLQERIQTYISDSRVVSYYLLASFQTLLFPSKYLLFATLPVLHTVIFSAHIHSPYTNSVLNATLHDHGYSLVARQESITGYISVLDNEKDGFRVMRCDHSLLGGEWHPPAGKVSGLREPVYAIFVMLEAVRLVQAAESSAAAEEIREGQEDALIIGLGIGTTPSALIAHGISTTIVEIDPVVHSFATKHFNLPSNHTAIIQDATIWVDHTLNIRNHKTYDYIIHDVFTGGAEPIDLFTTEFLQGLKGLLKAEGVIAINYAGDLLLPTAARVVRTILAVFPSCRLFREEPAPATTIKPQKTDFTNMVLFCRSVPGSFTFRDPTKEDFLGSGAREFSLLPRHEVGSWSFFTGKIGDELDVIRKNNTRRKDVEKAQLESALGHWAVMRTVLPDAVWENW